MGSSPSIENLQAKDDEFRKYLKTLEEDLGGKAADATSRLQADISEFYKANEYDDAKIIVSGRNADFMHQKEFSLDNLKKVIDGISAAVFSGAAPPKGATPNDEAVRAAGEALGDAVGAMSNLEIYIAGKVFDVLSNTVLSFGTGTQTAYTSHTKTESLGFGLQMFASVSASSYQSHSFFTNEYITQYLYLYDIRFSIKQAQAETEMGLVQAYESLMTDFEAELKGLGRRLGTSKPKGLDVAGFKTEAKNLQEVIDDYHAKIGQLKSAARAVQVKDTLNRALASS